MALSDFYTAEKQNLTALLETEYPDRKFRTDLLVTLFLIKFLAGDFSTVSGGDGGSGSGSGDASSANQTIVQANAGSDASKATAIQGITNGKAISVSLGSTQRTPLLTSVTNSGSIALGSRSVSIANIGSAAGIVLGTSVGAGVTVNFTAQGLDTLAAITYNATGTTFLIAEVR